MAVERADFNRGDFDPGLEADVSPFASPTVTAFVGRTRRGPLDEPVPVSSLDAFHKVFGGTCSFSYLPQAVAHYFAHGGQRAVVVRIANHATRGLLEVPAGRDVLRLQAREPGSEEQLRVSVDYDHLERDATRFNLVVQRLAPHDTRSVEDQEFFQGMSIDERSPRFVVDVLRRSRLVRLAGPLPGQRPEATLPKRPGEAIPYLPMTAAGSDGEEITDYDVIGSRDEATGLFALEHVTKVDLVCIPAPPGRDLGHTSFLAAVRYCERRHAMLIWDPSWSWRSAASALIGLRDSPLASPNALTYFPRLRTADAGGRPFLGVPACGVVAGLLARGDRYRGDPARQAVLLRRGFRPGIEVSPREAARLNRHGVNVFARTVRGHYAFSGNVTLVGGHALGKAWQNLERRRLALYIVGRIEEYVAQASAERDDASWAGLQRRIKQFLVSLYTAGMLAGSSNEQAFFTRPARRGFEKCSRFRFGFALETPAEFLAYQIERADLHRGLDAIMPLDGVQLTG